LPQSPTTSLALHKGWNWIGYLPRTAQSIDLALASISGKYQLVHSLLYTYNPSDPVHSSLHTMSPGEGYMIYMNEAATLVYPTGSGKDSDQISNSGCYTLDQANPEPDRHLTAR